MMMNRDRLQGSVQSRSLQLVNDVTEDMTYPVAGSREAPTVCGATTLTSASASLPHSFHRHQESTDSSISQLQDESQTSDPSRASLTSPGDHLQQQQQRQRRLQPTMGFSEGELTIRYLKQRVREEEMRANIAEQAYFRVKEENRILQQAYSVISPSRLTHFGNMTGQSLGLRTSVDGFPSGSTLHPSLPGMNSQHATMSPGMQGVIQQQCLPVGNTDPGRSHPTFATGPIEQNAATCSPNALSALSIVKQLGLTARHGQPYTDVTKLEGLDKVCCDGDNIPKKLQQSTPSKTFTETLHDLLTMAESDEEMRKIITFCPHGRAFLVIDVARFCVEVAPKFFTRLSLWKSFTRQLNLYGFIRLAFGPDAGAYYHELYVVFLQLCTDYLDVQCIHCLTGANVHPSSSALS
jgi:hypothetical protein